MLSILFSKIMEVDKFGRFRKNDTSGRLIPSYQLLQLQRYLKSDILNVLSEKNFDKLVLTRDSEAETSSSIRIRNVQSDQNSFPTDAVNISYMTQRVQNEISSMLHEKNLDKLILEGNDAENSIRIRNIRNDENSHPTDAVNVAYVSSALSTFRESIEKLENRIESLENTLVGVKSITYARDEMSTNFPKK